MDETTSGGDGPPRKRKPRRSQLWKESSELRADSPRKGRPVLVLKRGSNPFRSLQKWLDAQDPGWIERP
jgi:hypothetical protein